MSLSPSFKVNGSAFEVHEKWFECCVQSNVWLNEIMRHEHREKYDVFVKAHKAGRWMQADPGPHIGRVLVWKRHSTDHMDNADSLPTVVIVLSGEFVGGYMEFLDLQTRLLYQPGTVVAGWFSHLWHAVTEHTLQHRPVDPDVEVLGLTPGRVSLVSYFPMTSFNQLHDKPEGWAKKTLFGRLGTMEDSPPEQKGKEPGEKGTNKRGRGGKSKRRKQRAGDPY
jgi:hypothetical protein